MLASRSLIFACCFMASLSHAQSTWYVDDSGTPPGNGSLASPYTSIQYAIARPTTLNGHTLRVLPGTYVENVDFLGKALTVASSGGAGATSILGYSGGLFASCVIFQSNEGPSSSLRGFTLSGGFGSPHPQNSSTVGGGVFIDGASPQVIDCVVSGNDAQLGAGVFAIGGAPSFIGCTIENQGNLGGVYSGGGLRFESSTPSLTGTTIQGNQASIGGGASFYASNATLSSCIVQSNAGYDAGGLHFEGGSAHIDDSSIASNYAADGWAGGIWSNGCALVLEDVKVRSNTADNDHAGGGIYLTGGSLAMTRGELTDNFSAAGGGLFAGGTALLDGVRITDNTSQSFQAVTGNGGGVYGGSTTTLRSCVIAFNNAIEGAGMEGFGGGVYGAATIDRCTLWGNTSTGGGGGACGGAVLANTICWNNVPNANCATVAASWSDVQGGASGTGNFALFPQLVAPASGNFRLLPSSPCVNSGNPALTDADGTRVDVGAIPLYQGGGVAYCTAGTSAQGCNAIIDGAGDASLSRDHGFTLIANGSNGAASSAIFWGSASSAVPWGSSSWLCIALPRYRTGVQTAGGANGSCNGVIALDFNTWLAANPSVAPPAGSHLFAQAWYRDPLSIKKSALSNALEFVLLP